MKSRFSPSSLSGFVEPLESRIAPARVIQVGLPDFQGNDTNYTEVNPSENIFVNTESNPSDNISAAVGGGEIGKADTFYLRLSAGDRLEIYSEGEGGGFEPLLDVKSGNIVAFFVDYNSNNEIDANELTGISLGKNASIDLKGAIQGDIVSNLDERGTKSLGDDTVSMTGLVSSAQGIKGVRIGAEVGGSIISGGNIDNVAVFGNVKAILAGVAADGRTIDFFPGGVLGGDGVLQVSQPDGKTGASISRVVVDSVTERIEAGAGGAGAAGGSLKTIQITEDTDGYTLQAGAGGDTAKGKAGAGGVVRSIYLAGLPDPTNNDLNQVLGGVGGRSLNGAGGAGGSVSEIFVGYQIAANKVVNSDVLSPDNFLIAAGAGGDGKVGGRGGSVFSLDARFATPDAVGNEFEIRSGAGGDNIVTSGGSAGAGGSIRNVVVRDQYLPPNGDIVLVAGDGGAALTSAKGGAGGDITNATLLGSDFRIVAGNGSTGKVGGTGGSLVDIVIEQGAETLAHNAEISAGFGGDGTNGNGGNGGAIKDFLIRNGDFSTLRVNQGTQADGGNSLGGRGGKGGEVTNFRVIEFDSTGSNVFQGDFTMRAGDGGNGEKGGGAGGSVQQSSYEGEDMSVSVLAGRGGNATLSGNGGIGGGVRNVVVTAEGQVAGLPVSGVLASGIGGDGAGERAAGGKGGNVQLVNVNAAGSVAITAGDGGSGTGKAAGHGGSILISGGYALTGTGLLQAGDGGVGGALPGNGGSILGQSNQKQAGMFAAKELTVRAGDGTHGGSGGSIRFLGYGSAETDLTPTPLGNILIQAGNGSAEGKKAGNGGSLFDIVGALADTDPDATVPAVFDTTIVAGHGGGAAGVKKSGAGGSIANLTLERGGHVGSELTITAGNGGVGSDANTGGKGGSVRSVYVANIADGTIFRSIAAGDGGDGIKKGGLGGSVEDVQVAGHDIGVRIGEAYGYATMGGVFAGVGGDGAKAAANGSVKNITAEAIAAIVAGKGAAPQLVEKVENIIIGTRASHVGMATDLLKVEEGDLDMSEVADRPEPEEDNDPNYRAFVLDRYLAGNLVGAVKDPTRIDGNKFLWNDANSNGQYDLGEVPIDGLIAAKSLDQKTINFTAEAFFDGDGLFDHDNKFAFIPAPVLVP